jgi:acyl-[acyl-carrier-protein] desaturase
MTNRTGPSLADELEPVIGQLYERHLDTAKEWFPHDLVPWSRGRDFEPDEEWSVDASSVPEGVRSALIVNLLTEDNLPYYTRTIGAMERSEAWQEWSRRWTAEEGRHAIVIRDYLTVTRLVDPVALERARMEQVTRGQVPNPDTFGEGIAYVALQELATRIAHRNTGKVIGDEAGFAVMSRVAQDENLHHLFYRDLVGSALEIAPSEMMVAIDKQVRGFSMPGTGIPNFASHAKLIAAAGVYDFQVHHDAIVEPVVFRQWRVQDLVGLTDVAERARDRLVAFTAKLQRVAGRINERRDKALALA